MDNNSLSHHGTKGMKWGRRLYQNKDGTLTALGKKRYNKEVEKAKEGIRIQKNKARTQAKLDKLAELQRQARGETDDAKPEKKIKGKAGKADTAPKKKGIGDMTDEELNAAINRARMEDAYRSLRPDEISKGQVFANTMGTILRDSVAPALIDVGKKALASKLAEQYPEKKSKIDKLKDEYNLLKVKKDIEDLKNPKKSSDIPDVKTWEDMIKKQTYEKNVRDRAEAEANANAKAKLQKEADAKAKADARAAEARKQVDEYNKKWAEGKTSDNVSSGQYSKSGRDLTDAKTSTGTKSSVTSSSNVNSGKSAIAGLLSGPVSSTSVSTVHSGREATYEVLDKYGDTLVKFYD